MDMEQNTQKDLMKSYRFPSR
uniref:Uncharacterized protein n=1 Tax=Rhizophora mucronata TaxID=61149 RepID=A0A2P2QXR4_RHIMU